MTYIERQPAALETCRFSRFGTQSLTNEDCLFQDSFRFPGVFAKMAPAPRPKAPTALLPVLLDILHIIHGGAFLQALPVEGVVQGAIGFFRVKQAGVRA